jgi:hypothetical protein
MLRFLRPSRHLPLLRRLVAALLWSVLGLTMGAEPLLADACDGDAPAAAAAAVVPHTDGPVVANVLGATRIGGTDAPARAPDGSGPEHAVHVCHCTHAHGGTLTGGYALADRAPRSSRTCALRPSRTRRDETRLRAASEFVAPDAAPPAPRHRRRRGRGAFRVLPRWCPARPCSPGDPSCPLA